SHRGLRRRVVSSRLLKSEVSKSETQGQLSGCEGAIRSHFGLLFTWLAGQVQSYKNFKIFLV
ncbi:MAG: hypothetical protein ACK56F_01680, partial [bacterium]